MERPVRVARTCTRMLSATHAPRTCSMEAQIFAPSRSSSDTRPCRRRSATPTSRWGICYAPTTPRTRWPVRSDETTIRPSVAARFTRVLYSLIGSLLGAAVVALVEAGVALQAGGSTPTRALLDLASAELGVLAPAALGFGGVVAAVSIFLEP